MATSKKAVRVLSQERVSQARAAGDALGDVLVSIETGLGLHGETLGVISRGMATKEDLDAIKGEMATKADITELTELVKDGFASLGINIANGDHRIRTVR
jgi:hypothetical protein